jgi:hypothetical protein
LVQSTYKLWVTLLSNKYATGQNFLQANASSSSSSIWSSVIKAKNVLKEDYSWRAGSGSSSFWFGNWSTLGILVYLVPYIDIQNLQLTVKDVLTANNPHTNTLYTNLSHLTSDHINRIHMKFNDSVEDVVIWSNKKNGTYTPKSDCHWLLHNVDSTGQNLPLHSWSWI